VEYLDWQKHNNVTCPILFLQRSYDAQGKEIYKMRPDPLDLQGGLPSVVPMGEQPMKMTKLIDAGQDDKPYNTNSYPSFDPMSLNQGEYTPLDKMFNIQERTQKYSDNPMDDNWGGQSYSQKAVDSGKFVGDEVLHY